MKKLRLFALICGLMLCGPASAALRTFTSAGVNTLWSNALNWDTGVPVDTDTFALAAAQTCTFDVDQTAFAGLGASTIAAGTTLIASTTAGAYVLKMNGNLTVNGTLQAGTSAVVPYPATCTFMINFSSAAYSIVRGTTGSIKLYCTQPTNKYIYTNEALAVGEGTALDTIGVATDVTGDAPWNVANAEIQIVDSTQRDPEIRTLTAVAAGELTVSAGVTNAKSTASMIILVTRNIRITNVAASQYTFTYAYDPVADTDDYIACEINNCYRGIFGGKAVEFAGTCQLLGTSPRFWVNGINCVMSGWVAAPAAGTSECLYYCYNNTMSGVAAGWATGTTVCTQTKVSGLVFACNTGIYGGQYDILTSTGIIKNAQYGANGGTVCIYGQILSSTTADLLAILDITLANATLSGTTSNVSNPYIGRAYNTLFSVAGTEIANYNVNTRPITLYFESFDHDQVINAYKNWCRGGIVSSQTASPPTGYTIFYDHEVESALYPCLRQYAATVLPGTAIEVSAVIRNTDGIDVSSTSPIDLRPRLEIIDYFADPLVDATQTALDSDPIAVSDGTNTDWQEVDVIWANTGDAPRQVYVRIICYSHDASTHTIDEAWSVATYQDQIAKLYTALIPVSTDVATANTTTSFTLTAGTATVDIYNNMTLMVQDADDAHWELRNISDWTAGRVITVDTAFGFTPAAGDLAYVMGTSYGAPVNTAAISDAVWDEVIADHTGETTFGGELQQLDPNLTLVLADTSAYDTDAEHAAAIWNAAIASYGTAGTYGEELEDLDPNITLILEDTGTTIPGLIAALPVASGIADAVWDDLIASHTAEASFGGELQQLDPNLTFVLADTSAYDTDAEHAAAIWNALMSSYTIELSFGGEVQQLDPNITILKAYAVEWDPNFTTTLTNTTAIKAVTDIMEAVNSTVAVGNDSNNFTITNTGDINDVNDAYVGMTIYVKDLTTGDWESRLVDTWETGREVTVDADFTFTPVAGDLVIIWGVSYFPRDIYFGLPLPPEGETITIDMRATAPGGGVTTVNEVGDDP